MYMCVYIYVCMTMTKEAMNLKENMEVYGRRFSGRKRNRENDLII